MLSRGHARRSGEGSHGSARPTLGLAHVKIRQVLAVGLLMGTGAGAAVLADAALAAQAARTARMLSVKDEGHLHLVRESGSELLEEGTVSGTLPGTVKVRFNVGAVITAQFTIYARGGGSIAGHGSGSLRSTSRYSTFGGSLSVTSGTGRFAHARGSGGLYGAIDRRTYALTVQTIGKLTY
jgi:hypothetical protein